MDVFNNTTIANATEPSIIEDWIEQYKEPKALYIFRLSLFTVIILASLVGNSMVCYAVWNIPSRKSLSYHLVANMAFAQILSSVCFAVMIASYENYDHASLQKASCVVNPVQRTAFLFVMYSLAAIAFYRYRFIANPIARGPSVERIKFVTISGLWLLSLAISFPMFIGLRFKDGKCTLLPVVANKYYAIIKFILNFALPSVIMLASYGAVAWHLRERIVEKRKRARRSIVTTSCVVEIEDQIELQGLRDDKLEDTCFREREREKSLVDQNNRRDSKPETTDPEKDLLKMIFVLIIIFIVCYFPYQAKFVWERLYNITSYQFRYHQLMIDYVLILISLPGALHPLCYGTMNGFFAKAFSKIILCK